MIAYAYKNYAISQVRDMFAIFRPGDENGPFPLVSHTTHSIKEAKRWINQDIANVMSHEDEKMFKSLNETG